MSSPDNPPDTTKPAVKDKNPHNYRKVGYSMIVISVSLVVIGLLVWAIGDDYHFSTNIMAAQEVDAMTPKSGYNIVLFDISQPVGAKLKLLDQAGTNESAQSMLADDAKQNTGNTIQVLLFNSTSSYNQRLMADAEVYIQTPKQGYNVVLFNDALPVGQKLTLGIHEDMLTNATQYQKDQEDNLKGQDIQVLIFTPNFKDDLKMVTGSSVPVGEYAVLAANMTNVMPSTQVAGNQTGQTQPAAAANATVTQGQAQPPVNQTMHAQGNQSGTVSVNQTKVLATNETASAATNNTGTTMPANMTLGSANNTSSSNIKASNQTVASATPVTNQTAPTKPVASNGTAKSGKSNLLNLNETVGISANGK